MNKNYYYNAFFAAIFFALIYFLDENLLNYLSKKKNDLKEYEITGIKFISRILLVLILVLIFKLLLGNGNII